MPACLGKIFQLSGHAIRRGPIGDKKVRATVYMSNLFDSKGYLPFDKLLDALSIQNSKESPGPSARHSVGIINMCHCSFSSLYGLQIRA